jgi:formylglycine-generating enzyme required for sulfatase activity
MVGKAVNLTLKPTPKTGNLKIVSNPFDAQIKLNGKDYGPTPNTLRDILVGDYTLTLTKPGYGTVTKTITIAEGKTTDITETLPSGMEVTIASTPSGAQLWINGSPVTSTGSVSGTTPWKGTLAFGNHTLKLVNGKKEVTETITIASTPTGAQLWVDRVSVGRTPHSATLSYGSHTIKLVNGKKEVTETITVTQGGKARWEFDVAEGLIISIASTPTGAQLWIDGISVGRTPNSATLSYGNHTIKLVNGKKEVTETITVTQGGKARWEFDVDEAPAAGATLTEKASGLNLEMVFVKGGTFTMGCTAEQGNDCDDDEKPTFRATVSDFYMGKYEVTQAQWRAVMGSSPSYFKNCDNCPVEQVSWNDVQEFIRKLNQLTGKKYRLPTEAEWEFAARGGTQSKGYKYSGSNSIGEVAEYDGNNNKSTKPVGGKKPNELGLYDMSGNVWEWCSDWKDSYTSDAKTNPTGPSTGSYRVLRGGSWSGNARICRVSLRNNITPDDRNNYLGFRLALVP